MLYVFGDSYCHDIKDMELSNKDRRGEGLYPEFFPLEDNWVNIVSKKLIGSDNDVNDLQQVQVMSIFGINCKAMLPTLSLGIIL